MKKTQTKRLAAKTMFLLSCLFTTATLFFSSCTSNSENTTSNESKNIIMNDTISKKTDQLGQKKTRFKLYAPGPFGARQLEKYNYSQVMEIDGRIEISGQGGYHPETLDYPLGVPIETEISRAFDNVTFMLNSVGLDWSHVAHVNSYHVPEADGHINAAITEVIRQFGTRMPDHKPIWTALGVPVLGNPRMQVEIRVTAFRD